MSFVQANATTARRRAVTCLLALVLGFAGPVGAQTRSPSDPVVASAAPITDQIIHDYLQRHPEAVVEALRAAEAKERSDDEAEARALIARHATELAATSADAIAGNPAGSVTLIEFFDYQCPYCKNMAPTITQAIAENPELKVVYKDIPILGPASLLAGKAALAARAQHRYLAFHDALLAIKGPLSESVIMGAAVSIGLDTDRLKRDMGDAAIETDLKQTLDLARDLKIRGTPAIIIGTTLAPGALELPELQSLINQAHKG